MSSRIFLMAGALCAGLSVVFSAAFAHLPVFAGGVPPMVQTAMNQQQFHALGLLLVGLALGWRGPSRWLVASGWLMLLGMGLFSFNIYARGVLGWDALRALVPWGGECLDCGLVVVGRGFCAEPQNLSCMSLFVWHCMRVVVCG